MTYVITTSTPGGTIETYRRVNAHVGDEPIAGLVHHVAGVDATGNLAITSVFETKAHADRFTAERLLPALQAVGGEADGPVTVIDFEAVSERVATP